MRRPLVLAALLAVSSLTQAAAAAPARLGEDRLHEGYRWKDMPGGGGVAAAG